MRQFGYMPELEEFKSKGFVQHTEKRNLLRRLRIQHEKNFRMFKYGVKGYGCSDPSKYGSSIFGRSLYYYYDIRYKDKFVKYLVEEFYKENPSAGINMKREFTRLLHYHGLHWDGCCHIKNKKEKMENNYEDARKS